MASRRRRAHDGKERVPGLVAHADGLQREHVAEIQRARILRAVLEESARRGAGALTVAPIVARAGVSRRTFYELFDDVEDCLLVALDDALQRVATRVVPAWEQDGNWRERMRGALIELLSFLEGDPVTGRLLVVDTLAAGKQALERRKDVLAQLVAAVEAGRAEAKDGRAPLPLAGEGIVGAVLSILHARLLSERPQGFLQLTGPLMSTIVLPYLGPAVARRELERPLPERIPETPAPSYDGLALGDLPIRVTYRTLCALAAIGRQPGASNRQVGNAAGIEDQGQISKLLARLERVGLISNGNAQAPARGAANAWGLTERGEQIARTLRVEEAGASSA